ncbi:MAG: acyltransferase domain-containing protein, partial [Gaiellaceae bacterium]
SGQNCSWAGMGQGLLDAEPAFAAKLDECDAVVRERAGWSLREAIEQADETLAAAGPPSRVQPALSALQIALAALWRSWGIEPAAVVGHSVGEIAAACVAGALGVEQAMRLALERGAAMESLHGRGRTAAVALPADALAERLVPLHGAVWIAGVNAPEATVVAGEADKVEQLVRDLQADRVQATLLGVHSAFHGVGSAPLGEELEARLGFLEPGAFAIPMVSTLTGEQLPEGEPGAGYWARQMSCPVLFRDAVARLIEEGQTTFVEVAPHAVLRSALAANLRAAEADGAAVASMRRDRDERAEMLSGLARLYELGHAIDWARVHDRHGRVVTLPRYRWQHERLWLDPPAEQPPQDAGGHPLLGRHVELAHAAGSHLWEGTLDPKRLPYLLEHRIDELAVLPGSGYVELAVAAVERAAGWTRCELQDLRFERALVLDPEKATRIQTLLQPAGDAFRFSVHSSGAGGWTRHVSALVAPLEETAAESSPPVPPDAPVLEPEECYAGFTRQGADYGPAFRGIARAWTSDDGLLAELEAPQPIAGQLSAYRHHPALLDSWMHVVALAGGTGAAGFMPTGIPRLRIHGPGTRKAWSSVTLRGRESGAVTGDITVVDEQGRTVMEALGLRLRQLGSGGEAMVPRRYELRWQDAPETGAPRAVTGSWLVLADRGGVGERVADALRDRGVTVTLVAAGEPLPGGAGHDGVLHLWGLDAPTGLPRDDDDVEDAVRLGATSVLELARTIEGAPIWFVTRGAQAVNGEGAPAPLAAMSWGLGRTLTQERPALFGGLVDLDPASDPDEAARELVGCLERGGREDQLAVRRGRVLIARLAESDPPPAGDLAELRADSAYLVTGGLGGLGGATARWLAERGAGHLVLISRSSLPTGSDPSVLDASGVRPPGDTRVALVRELESLGATVHVAAADVAAPGALQAAIDELRTNGLPPIRGAVHAAGVPGFDALDEMSDEALRSVLAAKVEGSIALHRALEPEPLDFFTMFSSIAALLSSPRMGHYAAGNAFQGALAAHRRSLGLPAQALYWGVWGEVGMAVDTDGGPRTLRGHRSLSTSEGLRLLAEAARDPERDVALFEMDWAEWGSFYPRSAAAPLLELIADAQAPAEPEPGRAQERRFEPAATNGSAPATSSPLADRIVATVAETLRLPAVDPDDSLADLGFDSLMAAELRVRIEDEHGVRIPLLRMLEATSVRGLAETVAAAAGGEAPAEAAPPEESPSTELVPAPQTRPPAVRSPARLELDIIDELMLALTNDRAPASIHCEMRVEGRIDAHRLEDAIREAARAHPVTRGRLAPARPLLDTRYRWDVSDELSDVPLEVAECEDEAQLDLARERLLSDTPALDRSTFTMLLAHAPEGDTIVLNVHHAAGDGVAAFRFMTSIARAYAGEPDTVPDVDHATARDVHSLIGRSLRSRAKRLRGLPDSLRRFVKPPARLALPGAGERTGYGFDLFTLTPDEVERMLDRAPRGATLNDVMLGALAVTVRRWNERHGKKTGDVHVMYPVNVRPPGWSFDVFGNFAPWTAVRVTPKEQADVGSAAEAATWRTRKIRENGIAGLFMDVIELPHYLPVGIARHGPKLFAPRLAVDTTLLSNIGQVSNLPARLGDAGAVKTFWGTPPGYPRMETSFSAAVFRSQLFVGLRYSRSGFDRETAHELALLYRDTLLGGSPEKARELVLAGHDEKGGT